MSIFGDALNTGKQIIVDRLIPEYNLNQESTDATGSTLWSTNITQKQLIAAYRENGIGRKLVNKIASDTFDNWFDVESDSEQLIKDVEELFSAKRHWVNPDGNKHLGLKKNLKESDKVGMVEGYALLLLGFSDDGDLKDEVQNPRSLDYLSMYPKSDVKKMIIDKDKNSDHYGEIVGAKIKMGPGDVTEIHASRFMYLPVNPYGNNWEAIGYMRPAYNYLIVLDNVIWSTGQAFYRNAAGFMHFIKKRGKPDQMRKMKTQAKQTNSLTAWVSDETTEIKAVGVKTAALNPEQYWDVSLKAVAMSFDIPMQIVEGVAAGAVTGSETNLKDYYSDISSKQEIDWTPIVEQLIVIAQGTGQVAKGEFKIKWKPLQELTAKEVAEVEKIEAETVKIKTETQKMRIETGVQEPAEVKKELEEEAKTDAIPEFTYDDRTNLEADDVVKLEEAYSQDLQDLFSLNVLMKLIKDNKVVGILNDDFGDLERDFELLEQSRAKKVKDTVDKNIDASWGYGWIKSEQFLDLNIIASSKVDQIKKILKQSNYVFVNSAGKDVTKKTLFAVQQSVLAGEGIPEIRKKVKIIVDSAKHSADTIARTETHRAMTQSIKQSYRDSEIVEKVQYITAGDDVVRPSHAALDGHIFDLNNTPSELEDPNCRCTVVAYFGGR